MTAIAICETCHDYYDSDGPCPGCLDIAAEEAPCALVLYDPPGHGSRWNSEGLRRLLCAIAAGPALREIRDGERQALAEEEAATMADLAHDEEQDDRRERAREEAAERRRESRMEEP